MNRSLAAAAVLALAGAAGCAPHVWIDEGGQRVDLPVLQAPLASDPAEPSFCIEAFTSEWGQGHKPPLEKYGGLDGAVAQIADASNFRDLRSIVQDPRKASSCDLLVSVGLSGGDAAGTRCCDFTVRRPGASAPLWRAER